MTERAPLYSIGTKFGDWTIVAQTNRPFRGLPNVAVATVRCCCGREKDLANSYLRAGGSSGCGCKRAARFAAGSHKHGQSRSELYRLWARVKARLKTQTDYAGVRMHPAWASDFEAFAAYMETLGPKPGPTYSLDRIEPRGHYEPGNIRWASKQTQAQNRTFAGNYTKRDAPPAHHGKTHTPLFALWMGVRNRLKRDTHYASIRMCPEWEASFEVFEAAMLAMGPKPDPTYTLDRKDPSGNYEPGNVRWASKTEQSINRLNNRQNNVTGRSAVAVGQRYGSLLVTDVLVEVKHGQSWYMARVLCDCGVEKTMYQHQLTSGRTKSCGCFKNKNLLLGHKGNEKLITVGGETKNTSEWARTLGTSVQVVRQRVNVGWGDERAVTQPVRQQSEAPVMGQLVTLGGVTKAAREWATENQVPASTMCSRVRLGWPIERAVTEAPAKGIAANGVTIGGQTKSLAEWCTQYGSSYSKAYQRIMAGWEPEEALTLPSNATQAPDKERWSAIVVDGVTHSLVGWCELRGLKYCTVQARLLAGWTPERALMEPTRAGAGSQVVTIGGVARTAMDWARTNGVSLGTLNDRLAKGWDIERSVTETPKPGPRPRPKMPPQLVVTVEPAGEKRPTVEAKARPVAADGSKMVEIDGECHSVTEWCRLRGMPYKTVYSRIKENGWDAKRALSEPVSEYAGEVLKIDGVTKTVRQWCLANGVNYTTAYRRIKGGWAPARAVSEKARPLTHATDDAEAETVSGALSGARTLA